VHCAVYRISKVITNLANELLYNQTQPRMYQFLIAPINAMFQSQLTYLTTSHSSQSYYLLTIPHVKDYVYIDKVIIAFLPALQ
jgi:hypothetical protein